MRNLDLSFARACVNAGPVVDATYDLDASPANELFASAAMAYRTAPLAMVEFPFFQTAAIRDDPLSYPDDLSSEYRPLRSLAVWDETDGSAPIVDDEIVVLDNVTTGNISTYTIENRVIWPGFGHGRATVTFAGAQRVVKISAAFASYMNGEPVMCDVDSANSVIVHSFGNGRMVRVVVF